MKAPTWTVLHIGEDRLHRHDLNRDRELVHSSAIDLPSGSSSLLSRIETAMAQAAPLAPHVLVLHEGLWTQTVEVPAASAGALSREDLARALSFELEPFTGLSADESHLAFCRLDRAAPGVSRFWVTQIAEAEWQSLQAALTARGARQVLVAHPIGGALEPDRTVIEVWPSATACRTPSDLTILGARAGQRAWQQQIQRWLETNAPREVRWIGSERPTALTDSEVTIDDQGVLDERLDEIARRWVELVESASNAAPVIRRERIRRRLQPRTLGLIALVIVTALIVFDVQRLEDDATRLEARARTTEGSQSTLARQLTARRTQSKRVEEERMSVSDLRAEVEGVEREWKRSRTRPAALLRALGEQRPDEVTLTEIDGGTGSGFELHGFGIEQPAVDRFVRGLQAALTEHDARVHPPKTSQRLLENGRTLVEFSCRIETGPSDSRAGEKRH